jgi:hypothetical protein
MFKTTLRLALSLLCYGLLSSGTLQAQSPTDNPIASFYNGAEGFPAWTDEIRWDNVYNMATYDYSGCAACAGNDFEKFKFVRDIAYTAGGGVLYYPGGTYTFDISDAPMSEGLMLKKGVVIRGEKPASDGSAVLPNSDILTMSTTDHGLNNLPTKFRFTTTRLANDTLAGGIAKMWNCIGIKEGPNESGLDKVEKVGICWVDMEYGYIYFGFEAQNGWAANYGAAGYNWTRPVEPWKSGRIPDGTHPMDWFAGNTGWGTNRLKFGSKRFVFGVHLKQAGVPNYVLSHLLGPRFYTEDGPYWFGAKISVYGNNLFIANNVISKPTKCFKMKISAGAKKDGQSNSLAVGTVVEVPYDFGKGLSIDVNKNYVAGFKNNSAVDDPSSQYAPNVQIIDNWVYNHSSKGFDIAGGWMVVRNNINRRERLAYVDVYNLGLTSFYGVMTSNGRIWTSTWNDDFLARAFTVSSRNAWYHKNQWNNTGTAFDNSGEGILHQDHLNGSECYSAALTYNRGNSYVGVWNSLALGFFLGYNKVTSGIMLANPSGRCSDVSSVSHQNLTTGTEYIFDGGLASNANVLDFKSFNCSSPNPIPGTPEIEVKDTADYVRVTWTDVADEAAYRVERRKNGTSDWTTIAYRPRQESGSVVSFNGPAPSVFVPEGHGSDAWDGKIRDMNPKEWRDYMKSAGLYEYRVVAVGCGDTDEGTSDSVEVVVVTGNQKISQKATRSLINVSPNPAHDLLRFDAPSMKVNNWKVLDASGRVVWSAVGNDNSKGQIRLEGWKPGIYFLQAEGETENRSVRFAVY